jgi:hypothetical protein
MQISKMFSKLALTAALAATLVLAPAALAREVEVDDVTLVDEDAAAGRDLLLSKTVSKKKNVSVTNAVQGGDKTTVTSTTSSNTISCDAKADSKAISEAKDAHVNAYAEAHKYACSGGSKEKTIVKVWAADVAVAVAKVSAEFSIVLV